MQKQVLATYKLFDAISGATSIQSSPVGIKFTDNVSIQIQSTGTLAGTFAVQVSNDFDPNLPTATANWSDLALSAVPTLAGSSDSILIDLTQVSAPFIRLSYTATSGAGNISATIAAKGI
jgi:hypothetical protein